MENAGATPSPTMSTNSFFTPLLISILGIGATALVILIYHLLVVRYCMRRQAARMASLQAFAGAGLPTGVDEKSFLTMPIISYVRPGSADADQCECAVCLGDMEEGDRVRLLPNCKHVFHVRCIDEWFVGHTSCPVCRVPVVAQADHDDVRSCPVCRASADDHSSVGYTPECDDAGTEVLDGDDNVGVSASGGPRVRPDQMLRHCKSLVLPRERKARFSGMELKRSLSMGQSTCVSIHIQVDNLDIQVDNLDRDCSYYSSFRDRSIRRLQSVSSKVRQSFSRMCVGQGSGSGRGNGILPY